MATPLLSALLSTTLQLTLGTLPLANPGFEKGLAGWNVKGTASAAESNAAAASMGDNGLEIKCEPNSDLELVSSPVPVKSGETYAVSFWGGGSPTHPGNVAIKMVFRDSEGKEVPADKANYRKWPNTNVRGSQFINHFELAAAAPQKAVDLVVLIKPDRRSPKGSVYLDDFEIDQVDDPSQRGKLSAEKIAELEKEIASNPHRGKAPTKVVIKLDDFRPHNGNVHPQWSKVADYAKSKGIPVTFGVIAKTQAAGNCDAYLEWSKKRHAAGEIEFWHHGWDHAQWKGDKGESLQEFKGSGYDHQKKHMDDTSRVAREQFGFPFVTFGAPFNGIDEDTVRVLEENPDIKVWLYGNTKHPAGKIVLQRAPVNIESPTSVPNYPAFVNAYAHNRGAEYLVLQGHPMGWDAKRWKQFTSIIELLLAQEEQFVRASDFAAESVPADPATPDPAKAAHKPKTSKASPSESR